MRRDEKNGDWPGCTGCRDPVSPSGEVEGGDTAPAPATVTHTFDWKCDCFLIPVLLIMLCANESRAPGVFQLLPGSQEPDPHNKIVYSRSAVAGTRE